MQNDTRRGFKDRIRAFPGLLAEAPAWLVLVAGIAVTLLGALIVSRPLTSLVVLGIYIGVSCLISGVADLLGRRDAASWYGTALGLLWIAAGVATLVWLGRSIELLPAFLALLLIVSGAIRLAGAFRSDGRDASERALAASFGVAEIAFGIFALAWPDLTLIVVATLFGLRTIVFGLSLLWRAGRALSGELIKAARWVAAVVVLALAAGTLWVSNTLRSGAPVVDAFYTAPATVPSEPGRLLRFEPYTGQVPAGMSAWRILYTTTARDGVPALASALVGVPTARSPGPRPVIAWNHGTVGVARACAPSLTANALLSPQIPAMDAVVSNGWAIVATDYTGMGAEGIFPYLIGPSEARSILDGVRAAHQLPSVNLSNTTLLWGHSQGGHATLWAAQIAASYAPELQVVGTAALSPASDPPALVKDITAKKSPTVAIVTSYVLVPYSQYYDDVKLGRYVATSARRLVREIAGRCPSEPGSLISVLNALAVSGDRPMYQLDSEALSTSPFADRLAENVPRGPFTQSLLIAQGDQDEVIAPSIQDAYVASRCASGQALEYRVYPGKSHFGVVDLGSPLYADLEQWTKDRLAGLPSKNTCPP